MARSKYKKDGTIRPWYYQHELDRLEAELVKLSLWIKETGTRAAVLFEGRDAAGKGGVIKRITNRTNPRIVRLVALGVPSEQEKSQWYFQRYVSELPSAGELVLFDRSWYNRALVEHVMGFCTPEQYQEFLRACPEFERMLINDGIHLIKYWYSISDREQDLRFQRRLEDPRRRWKLSEMDLEIRKRWVEYSRAKDSMFIFTDTADAPWYVVDADLKKHARLNCIAHLLSQFDYEDLTPEPVEIPPRQQDANYVRPPITHQTRVPAVYPEEVG